MIIYYPFGKYINNHKYIPMNPSYILSEVGGTTTWVLNH